MKKYFHPGLFILLVVTLIAGCAGGATTTPKSVQPPMPTAAATQPRAESTPPPARATPVPPPTRASTPGPAPKPDEAPYYKGKTIEMVISSAAGGGTDTTGRLVASFLPKYIPGNPRIVVRNVPGGEGTIANNNFVEKSKKDGLSLVVNASSQITVTITRPDIAHYNPAKYEHVGNVSRATSIMVIRKQALNRLIDPKAAPVNIGAREGNETWAAMPLWAQEYLGWNLKWILGFGGTSELELALRRGEIDMFGTSTPVALKQLRDEGVADLVVQEGVFSKGKKVRRPDFTDVPIFEELLGNKMPTGLPWQAYKAWTAPSLVDKWISAPPGTPANLMKILTDAFEAMAGDKEFDKVVQKVVSPVYTIGVGEDTATLVKEIMDTSPEVFKYGTDLQAKFGVTAK
ncbi:MAG: hypothetical protein U1D67_09015 [Dehalococcoidia bacterium]|nr:tripartite tricarboxylate transporter substrate-binding protein [Dehalococcoidia bacterium]MDZ4247244.1 hypothetical protein [Dehalococcoidia bacterium]